MHPSFPRLFVALLLLFGGLGLIQAQITTQNQTPMSGGHDYIQLLNETVNPANGSVSLRIQLPTAPGRGLTIGQGFNYDSASTYLVTGPEDNTLGIIAQSNLSQPWTTSGPSISWTHSSTTTYDDYGNVTFHGCGVNSSFVFQDLNGEKHSLGGMYGNEGASSGSYSPCGADQGNLSGGDGSVQSVMSSADLVLVADAGGTIYTFGLYVDGNDGFQTTIPIAVEDTNGNLISYGAGGVINGTATSLSMIGDTFGRPIGSVVPTNIALISTPRRWTVNTQNLLANPDWLHGCERTVSGTMDAGYQQFQSIGLPNGTSYKFEYDPLYGLLSKVTYPNGAFVRYEWGTFPLSDAAYYPWKLEASGPGGPNDAPITYNTGTCSEVYDWPVIQHRYVSYDGVHTVQQQDFTYTVSAQPGTAPTSRSTTVLTKDLITGVQNTQTYSSMLIDAPPSTFFSEPPYIDYLITTKDANGATLETVEKQWYDDTHLSALTIQLNDGSTSETDYTYYCPEEQQACPTNSPSGGLGQPILPLETDYYDFGPSQHGGLLKKTINSYAALPASPYFQIPASFHDASPATIPLILDRPSQITTYDSTGPVATTVYCYDQWPVSPLSGIVQHDDAVFTATYNIRGNLTQTLQWVAPSGSASSLISPLSCGQGSSASSLSTTYKYDQTGRMIAKVDPRGTSTTYSYSDVFRGSPAPQQTNGYLTKITTAGISHQYTWDYSSGLLATVADQNDINANRVGVAYQYNDPLLRASEVDNADGGKTLYHYLDIGPSPTVSSSVLKDSNGTAITTTLVMDGMGHQTETQINSDPTGAVYADTTYTGMGQVWTASTPYRPSDGMESDIVTNQYDSLGRKISAIHRSDGNSESWSYGGNVITYADEAGHSTARTIDALGRLTQVVESGSGTTGLSTDIAPLSCAAPIDPLAQTSLTCVLPTPGPISGPIPIGPPAPTPTPTPTPPPVPAVPTGAITTYVYDALNNLRFVEQHGTGSETPRKRHFFYDSLSRLLSSTNPETGKIHYGPYDGNGNLLAKTDANGTAMQYTYDGLNRLINKSSSNVASPDDNAVFTYDTCPNGIGRLCLESVANGSGTTFSYDSMGRVAGTDWFNYAARSWQPGMAVLYDLAGNIKQLTYPDGRVVQQAWDGAGRLSGVTDTTTGAGGPAYFGTTQYYPSGALQSATLGNGVSEVFTLNTRLQPCRSAASTPLLAAVSDPAGGNLYDRQSYYNPTATSPCGNEANNNGNVYAIVDNLAATAQGFGYDGLNRLTSATRPSGPYAYSHTYNYDSFGNMLLHDNLNYNLSYSIDPATNRLLLNGSDLQYYNDGSLASSPGMSYGYTPEGHLRSINNYANGSYLYNGQGERTLAVHNSNTTGLVWNEYVYLNGQPMADVDNNGNWTDTIYANGAKIAQVASSPSVVHLFGTNVSGSVATGVPISSLNGVTVAPGDTIRLQQWTAGDNGEQGGIQLGFTDGEYSTVNYHGPIFDQNGCPANLGCEATGQWIQRSIDISVYSGLTISQFLLLDERNGAMGHFDFYFADLALQHADGTVVPIWTGGSQASLSATVYGPGTATGAGVAVQTPPGASTAGVGTHYYLDDHLGTTQMELSSGGWPVWQGAFTPFGQEIIGGGTTNYLGQQPQDGTAMRYKFTGKERDAESGLDYFGARYLSSSMGRFMSPDWSRSPSAVPYANLDNPQSLNLYAYVGNNPLSRRDADGHVWKWLQAIANCFRHDACVSNDKVAGVIQKRRDWLQGHVMVTHPDNTTVDWKTADEKTVNNWYDKSFTPNGVPPQWMGSLPTPTGGGNSEMGRIMKWGTGDDVARARIETLTREELEKEGVTKEMAEQWRDFYKQVKEANPNNPSAAGRADLMEHAVKLLSDGK